jgi:hypothetical protein
MAETKPDSGDIVVFIERSQLSPAQRAGFEQMHAEMEADRAAENETEQTGRTLTAS